MEKTLTIIWEFYKIVKSQVSAAMAQSVERILGKDEVGGSNPPSSSKNPKTKKLVLGFLFFLKIDKNKQM